MFVELKNTNGMAGVPTNTWLGNRVYVAATIMAHKPTRELTMSTQAAERDQTARRTPLWRFARIGTVRRQVSQRAGRLICPQGKLTLSVSANAAFRCEIGAALEIPERAPCRSCRPGVVCNAGGSAGLIRHRGVAENATQSKAGQPLWPRVMAVGR